MMNKKEFKELDKEQMIIAFNQLKDDYSVLFDKLEQEKEKNSITLSDLLEYKEELTIEKEKNKELYEQNQIYALNGSNINLERHIKNNYISKDKIKKTQGELCMQLESYVQNEASPEQERIAGGINIINKILKEE